MGRQKPLVGMGLRVGQTRAVLLGVFLLLSFILYFRSADSPSSSSPTTIFSEVPSNGYKDKEVPEVPRSSKIAMVSMSTNENVYDYRALSNKFMYARSHGYHLEFDWKGDGAWHKLKMIERLIQRKQFEWIWWIDFDTLITNTTVNLEDLIDESLEQAKADGKNPDDIDMILTPDCFPLNAGVLLMRSNSRVSDFFTRSYALRDSKQEINHNPNPSEQDCFTHLLEHNEHGEADRTIMIAQWKMNAFPEEIPCYDQRDPKPWERGMFVVHFAGAWAHMQNVSDAKAVLFEKYQHLIVPDDWERTW